MNRTDKLKTSICIHEVGDNDNDNGDGNEEIDEIMVINIPRTQGCYEQNKQVQDFLRRQSASPSICC